MPPSSSPERALPPPIDEEERAFRASFAQMVEWYRVEQWRALWRAFWPAAFVFLPLGSLLVALPMVDRAVPFALQPIVTVLGLLVTACGPLWAIVQLLRSIRSDLYVAIRVDGLAVRLDPKAPEVVYAWDAIVDARCASPGGALLLSLRTDEQVAIAAAFSDLDLPELGRRIRDARRLAVWSRLEPRFAADASE